METSPLKGKMELGHFLHISNRPFQVLTVADIGYIRELEENAPKLLVIPINVQWEGAEME